MTETAWISDAERITALRDRVLRTKDPDRIARLRDTALVDAASLKASEHIPSWTVRRGLITRDRLQAMRFALDPEGLLVGQLRVPEISTAAQDAARAYLMDVQVELPGTSGHCELDLDPLMRLGVDGLLAEVDGRRAAVDLGDKGASSKAASETYQAFRLALQGLSRMIEGAAEVVEEAAAEAEGGRKAELEDLALACRRIAHAPPSSFFEALQLLWFVLIGVMHAEKAWLVVPGHLDRTLRPFYDADVAQSRLTPERALLLIENLYVLINAYIADGLAMSVMVGGRDAEGRDVTHELSYLCLEALRRTNMIYPAVGVCWHEGTPDDLVDLAVELMGKGYPTPAFFSDATIQRGLADLGVPPSQACHYINSTCVEITPSGASNVWVASPYFNTCELLLDEIAQQVEQAAAAGGEAAAGFDDFLAAYRRRLSDAVAVGVAEQNARRLESQRVMRRPLQSVFTRDCLARGRDIEEGGARYNWIECSFIGLANLVDGLYVIREEVYEQRRLTLAQLKAVLDTNFEGLEPTRQRFLNAYPKYGQGNAEVDRLLGDTVEFLTTICASHEVAPDGSPFVPGAFAWVMHERLGRETGATPDGRRAGFPFADGCGPAQGRESRGPTAAVLSVTEWDHSPMIGGLAYNLKFNSSLFRSADGFEGLKALILTYLRRGGFEVQVNVVDAETLKAARVDPEQYRDLIVRIGGYCDYFTRLSPEMQDELILRTEFEQF